VAATSSGAGINELRLTAAGTPDQDDVERILQSIRAAAGTAFVVACLHNHDWRGDMRVTQPWAREFARSCAEAGAGAFFSHGAPLLHGIELHHGVPIFHGMGSLIFHSRTEPGYYPPEVWESMIAHLHRRDGSMRQLAPISPVIHLGAKQVCVISTNFNEEIHPEVRELNPPYPNLAQIAGHTLSNIFLDGVSVDLESTERINSLLARIPTNGLKSESLRSIHTLTITPSRSLDELALEHLDELPRAVRTLFRVLGISPRKVEAGSGALASYLLFESGYTRNLIALGRADGMSHAGEVIAFFKEWSA